MKKAISTDFTADNIASVLNLLENTPVELKSLSGSLSADQLRAPLAEGERSFTENLAHLINLEARTSEAIYTALILKEPLLHPIHPERDWGKLLHYQTFDFAELLVYFTFRRKALLQVLTSLTEKQWSRVVREAGKQRQESVYWLARGLALHELEHLDDLREKLSG